MCVLEAPEMVAPRDLKMLYLQYPTPIDSFRVMQVKNMVTRPSCVREIDKLNRKYDIILSHVCKARTN